MGNVNNGSPMGTGDTRTGAASVTTTAACTAGQNTTALTPVHPSSAIPTTTLERRSPVREVDFPAINAPPRHSTPTTPSQAVSVGGSTATARASRVGAGEG